MTILMYKYKIVYLIQNYDFIKCITNIQISISIQSTELLFDIYIYILNAKIERVQRSGNYYRADQVWIISV